MKSDLVEVAILGKSVGLKGFLRLHNRSDFPEQFKKGAKFYDKNGFELVVKHFDRLNNTILFAGFESIESAKTLTNKILYSTKELTRKNCKLKKEEYFYFDILGLKIIEDGEILGEVVDIEEGANNHLLHITTDEKLVEQGFVKNFYVPYINRFVIKVDLDARAILTKYAKSILENS